MARAEKKGGEISVEYSVDNAERREERTGTAAHWAKVDSDNFDLEAGDETCDVIES